MFFLHGFEIILCILSIPSTPPTPHKEKGKKVNDFVLRCVGGSDQAGNNWILSNAKGLLSGLQIRNRADYEVMTLSVIPA